MSRRFREPASSASSKRFTKPQSHPSPAPSSRSSRFARPTSTQDALSTSVPNVFRFRDRPKLKDEIETSFEEAEQTSPLLPSRSRLSSSVSRLRDGIDDFDDHEPEPSGGAPRRRQNDQSQDVEEDGLADLKFLEQLRGGRMSQSLHDRDIDSSNESDSWTPYPSRKRRRLENRTDHDFNASEHDTHLNRHCLRQTTTTTANITTKDDLEDHSSTSKSEVDSDSDSQSDVPSSPLAPPIHSTSMKFSRFKHPDALLTPHTSINTSTPTTTLTTTNRPSFRPLPSHNSTSDRPTHLNLPLSFSPSRRRRGAGGTSYLPGGAADTLRGWVVGLGAVAAAARCEGRGAPNVEMVGVADVIGGEGGGRCILIRDEGGRGWCLIGSLGGGGAGAGGAVDRGASSRTEGSRDRNGSRKLNRGSMLTVRMGWDVDLRIDRDVRSLPEEDDDDDDEKEDEGGGQDDDQGEKEGEAGSELRETGKRPEGDVWNVAVLWDVAAAGTGAVPIAGPISR